MTTGQVPVTPVATKPIYLSKTFWGAVIVLVTPVLTAWFGNGHPPDAAQIGIVVGGILAAAGFRDQTGRIEAYIQQLVKGAESQ
jgi:hypothetical protein